MKKNRAFPFILKAAKKEAFSLSLLTITNALVALLGVVFALTSRNVINFAVASDIGNVKSSVVFLICIAVVSLVLYMGTRLLASRIAARLEIFFRENVFGSFLRKEYSKISDFHSGDVITRLFEDVAVVSEGIATLVPGLVGIFTRLISALVAVFVVDKTFALTILIGGILLFIFACFFRDIMKKTHKDAQAAGGKARSFLQEACENVLIIKAFDMQEEIEKEESKHNERHFDKKMKRALFSTVASGGFSFLIDIGYIYAIAWGAFRIISGGVGFGYGDFVAILQLIGQVQAPFASLSGGVTKYYAMIASAERMLELSELPDEERAQNANVKYEDIESIELSGITFSYGDGNVFSDASVSFEKGKLTLISGSSGIGKSTLMKLLLGVIKPTGGKAYIRTSAGEIPIGAGTRKLFAYVPQGNFIMSGTIRENLCLVKSDATSEEILFALSASDAGFILSGEVSLDAELSERGAGLSEGQIQRLAIARAILSGAPVLLLDEATSALDEETERRVLENIMKLPGRTCICISHRSAARAVCGKEISVKDGKILEGE